MNRPSRVHPTILLCLLAAVGALPAQAGFRVERELALAPGGQLVIDADAGAIELRAAERSGAHIVITSPKDDVEERYRFSFESEGDVARVRVERRSGLVRSWFSSNDRLQLTVAVPRRTGLDLRTAGGAIDVAGTEGRAELHTSGGSVGLREITGDVRAHTSGGPMSAERMRGRLVLETSGGSIRVAALEGELQAETSGGSIQVHGVSGDARLETSGGSIEVDDAGGLVKAHTSGGPVRARLAAGNGKGGSLSSSGGGITVTLDPALGLEIDAATSGGRVKLDLPVRLVGSVERDAVRGSINGGGPRLKLRSSGGSIHLRSL